MYDTSVRAIRTHLVRQGGANICDNCTYVGQWNYRSGLYKPQMDHLVCFVPGMLALGADGVRLSGVGWSRLDWGRVGMWWGGVGYGVVG